MTRQLNRRQFVARSTAAAAAIAGLPYFVPERVLRRPLSDRLRVGCIGVGRQGQGDMQECLVQGLAPEVDARIVAVCDLDKQRAEQARQKAVQLYAQRAPDDPPAAIDVYQDFRELLARDDLDAVTITTPDHWHALAAIAAAQAGKSIHLQKPLTFTLVEGQKLIRAVRQHGVILQTGSQQRSDATFRKAVRWVRGGRLGSLKSIHVTLPPDSGTGDPTGSDVPDGFDFETWLGPAAEAPYAVDRVHPQDGYGRPGWLQIEDYCRGMITGWGSHMFDIAQWGHDSDDSGPVHLSATAEFPERGLFNVHTQFQLKASYADGVALTAATGQPGGVRFEGSRGSLSVSRGKLEVEPKELSEETGGDEPELLPQSDNHMRNFLHSVRSGSDPICPVEIGHRSNSICVIAHIAMKLGRPLHWDPQAEQFRDDPEANALLDYPHRTPWTV